MSADPMTTVPAGPRRGVRLRTVRRWGIASVVANIGIVVTGGAVRLTASGLGCPTWPRCTEDSFIPTGEAGIHEAIEFGNRLLTFVLVAIAVGTFVAVWRHRPRSPRLVRPALLLGLGIPAQAVIGGISVLTDLNPWIVAGHLLVSMVLIGVAVVLVRRAEGPAPEPFGVSMGSVRGRDEATDARAGSGQVSMGSVRGRDESTDASAGSGEVSMGSERGRHGSMDGWTAGERPEGALVGLVHPLLRRLSLAVLVLTGVVVWLGTIVTGSGPHAGDAAAPRTGLDLQLAAQAHADAVFLLVGVTVATVIAARMLEAPTRVRTAVHVVLGVQVVQGVIGYAQWFSGLPPLLVAVHLLGAGLAVASATDLRVATLAGQPRRRSPRPVAAGAAG